MDEALLTPREQLSAIGVGNRRWRIPERIDQVLNLAIAQPELALVNTLDTSAKGLKRLLSGENTDGAGTNCFDHGLILFGVEQDDRSSVRVMVSEPAPLLVAVRRA